jgi:endoglucanase
VTPHIELFVKLGYIDSLSDHFTSASPTWNVDPAWLQRVSDVVDMITSQGFYTIVNVHHDSWTWADVSAPGANLTMIEEKFYRLWYQIGTKLACKGSQVAFEPINEPPVSSNFATNVFFL